MTHLLKGKSLATGTHHIHKPKTDTALREVEWQTTLSNNIRFQSGQLIRLEYRYQPQNESLESVFLDYRLTNNSGAPVDVLPIWAGAIREMRIFVNQKKILDLNREEEIMLMWKNKLLTDYGDSKHRDNAYYARTGQASTLDGAGKFTPVTVAAGESEQFHLEFSDWCDLLTQAVPLNRIAQIEVEFNLSGRGDWVCNPQSAVGDLQIDNLSCYSRHKRFGSLPPPTALQGYTFHYPAFDLVQIQPSQHPFNTAGFQEYDVNISYEIPKRRYLKRLFVFARSPSNPDAYRDQSSDWVASLDLLSGGVTQLGVENHYKTERRIFHEVSEYLRRHHSVHLPSHPLDTGHGESFLTCFVDLTTVKHTQVCNPNTEIKEVELNGTNNFANLVLRIKSNATVLPADANVYVVAEYYRFSRLGGNGSVVEIMEVNA